MTEKVPEGRGLRAIRLTTLYRDAFREPFSDAEKLVEEVYKILSEEYAAGMIRGADIAVAATKKAIDDSFRRSNDYSR